MADRLGNVNASLRSAQRDMRQQLDETVIVVFVVVERNPNTPTGRRVNATTEAMGKIADETQ